MSVYLDCAATTPVEPRVADEVVQFMLHEFGNAGSRTHDFGVRARRASEQARNQVAALVGATRGEIVFTSGATESNNLAILGLAAHGLKTGRKHIVSTQIEHASVLGPLEEIQRRGFEVTLIKPNHGGWVEPAAIRAALRPDTLLVSVLHVNNETGIIQPLAEIAEAISSHEAYLHVDAAQGVVLGAKTLSLPRIDMISISGHKIYAPKGIGALVARRRGSERPPLSALMHGGGQELGLRPGTLPVHLAVGLGKAAELVMNESAQRTAANLRFRKELLAALSPLQPALAGDQQRVAPHIINLAFPGVDSEVLLEALADLIAASNGAACTTSSQTCSHVLTAMDVDEGRLYGAIRLSWCHLTGPVDWPAVVARIRAVAADAAHQ